MGGDGTICQVLTAAAIKQHGEYCTDFNPLGITVGTIPTGAMQQLVSQTDLFETYTILGHMMP